MYVGKKRRIRHIQAILGRSISPLETTSSLHADSSLTQATFKQQSTLTDPTIVCKGNGLLDTHLTLYTPHDHQPFYTSGTIPYSINPAFQTPCLNDGTQVVVKIWARPSSPDSRTQPYDLILEWSVDLGELVFVGTVLQGFWPKNTLIFELDDGYYTAPDIAKFMLAHADNAGTDSVQSQRSKRSYTYHHIMKLNTLKECLWDTQCSAKELQSDITLLMEKDNRRMDLSRQKVQKETKLKELESAIMASRRRIEKDRQRVDTLRKIVHDRNQQLKQYQAPPKDSNDNNTLEKTTCRDLFTKLDDRRKELIADLFSLYPIEQILDDSTQYRIRGLHLPNSVYTDCDEDTVATALGFTSHLVMLLALYFSIPLRYPMNPMGSRASIHDPVSLINGSRTQVKRFPLYGKGVDAYRFEFGVFLLNKNIEQMMNTIGLNVVDLRHTLPNIHSMIQTVLTTSIPTSIAVLSIPSYPQQNLPPKSDDLSFKLGMDSALDIPATLNLSKKI